MDAYAVCLTAVIGRTRKTVFSMINSINLDMTFNELFKDCVTQKKKNDADEKGNVRQDQELDVNLVRVRVSAGPNGPWHEVQCTEGLGVLRDLGQRHIQFEVVEREEEEEEGQHGQVQVQLKERGKKNPTVRSSRFFFWLGRATQHFFLPNK